MRTSTPTLAINNDPSQGTRHDDRITDKNAERKRLSEESKFANLESRTWLTGQQRARYLGLAEGTDSRYQKLGIGPRAIKIGNGSRSRRDWCDQWIFEGGVARADRAVILRAANKAAAARRDGAQSHAA